MAQLAPDQILNLPMGENDSGETTIRGYLVSLTRAVWDEQEDFSGKRPFGNSGWSHELYDALAEGGAIASTRDEDGDLNYDWDEADAAIGEAIDCLKKPSAPSVADLIRAADVAEALADARSAEAVGFKEQAAQLRAAAAYLGGDVPMSEG